MPRFRRIFANSARPETKLRPLFFDNSRSCKIKILALCDRTTFLFRSLLDIKAVPIFSKRSKSSVIPRSRFDNALAICKILNLALHSRMKESVEFMGTSSSVILAIKSAISCNSRTASALFNGSKAACPLFSKRRSASRNSSKFLRSRALPGSSSPHWPSIFSNGPPSPGCTCLLTMPGTPESAPRRQLVGTFRLSHYKECFSKLSLFSPVLVGAGRPNAVR